MPKETKPCGVPLTVRLGVPDLDGPLCDIPRKHGGVKCLWHWLMRQPIETQVKEARRRRRQRVEAAAGQVRERVPEAEWPEGTRWCSGCQTFIPLFYVSGSRCRACSSQATHANHVRRTYGLDPEEYDQLLAWQDGRCYICGQVPRVRRLAVDHDHSTGAVRGLLCANDEFGCNVTLRRLLNDLQMARRALEYVERTPLDRMRAGEAPRGAQRRPGLMDLLAGQRVADDWDPFGERTG